MKVDLFGQIIVEEEESIIEKSKRNPFDYIKSISNKEYIEDITDYNEWLTNNSFSQRTDTVFYANEMNKYYNLPKSAQYNFYYHALPKKNLFAKWSKAMKSEYTEMIMEYFNVSYKVAKQYEKILLEKHLQHIAKWYNSRKGGNK